MRTVIFCQCLVLAFLLLTAAGSSEAAKKHPPGSAGRECSECHASQTSVWEGGAHGIMNVTCVVCHGSPEQNFVVNPGTDRCRGCHSEEVRDMEMKPAAKNNTCFLCHDPHTVAVKESAKAKAGFHKQGGAK